MFGLCDHCRRPAALGKAGPHLWVPDDDAGPPAGRRWRWTRVGTVGRLLWAVIWRTVLVFGLWACGSRYASSLGAPLDLVDETG